MKVTNIGITIINEKTSLVLGDEVILKRELGYKYDKNAIKCFKNKEFIGYVCSDDYVVPNNCIVNKKLVPYFKFLNEIPGKVITSDTIIYGKDDSKAEAAYILEIYLPDIEAKEREKEKKLEVLIGGSMGKYPYRDEVEDKIKNGESILGRFNLKDEEVVIEDKSIGNIVEIRYKDNVLTDYKYLLKDNSDICINSKEGKYLLGEMILPKKTEKKIREIYIEELIEKIVEKGMDTKENIEKKIDYINNNNIPKSLFINILKTYIKYNEEDRSFMKKPEFLYRDKTGIMKRALHYLTLKDRNITLVGERGAGKSTMAETIAWLFNRPVITISFSRDIDKYDIWGYKTIDITEDGERMVTFADGPLTKAIKNGYITIFDEINVADPGVLESMNSILDHRRQVYVPELGQIKAHKNFMAITTENDDTYQGVNKLNEAFRDRFIRIRCIGDDSIKELLAIKNPDLKPEVLEILDNIYKGIRLLIKEGEISEKSLSIRGFENASIGYDPEIITLKEILMDCVANQGDNEDDRGHIMNIINMEVL
ncbi:AAA family ATPase [Anaerosalibacter massiliensis]|uniref:AAA family ATPase n=1 Tax=Anaerosalibacter massiliensis TaxID=1347392 RepID=A0A9X2MI31_9FIRM|nr:AAA family ATPase [Anaerosalibacter massiliensis]MCR2043572.1 AAA family ATPase [Anaerosalibacter massiliensis]